jgi:hypothetical protein
MLCWGRTKYAHNNTAKIRNPIVLSKEGNFSGVDIRKITHVI